MSENKSEKQFPHNKDMLDCAIQALKASTGIRAEIKHEEIGLSDCQIEITPPGKSIRKKTVFDAEVKRSLTQAALGEIFIRTKNAGRKIVLVTQQVTAAQADLMRNLDIAFFDTGGNAYFNSEGLYVYVNTKKSAPAAKRITTEKSAVFRPSDLKILFALLSKPGLENEDYRTISAETNVALGSISRHIMMLKEHGFLKESENGQRKLIRKLELLKLWVDGFIEKMRSRLIFDRFETSFSGRWWEKVELNKFDAYWSGETGAEKITGYLKPQIVTLYADNVLPRLQAENGLKRKSDGDVEILRKFWGFNTKNNIAPPLLIYADLVASGDSRNLDTAKKIYDEHLDRLVRETAG